MKASKNIPWNCFQKALEFFYRICLGERGELDTNRNGYQASTWRTNNCNCSDIYIVMYGGPRRPNFSPFQGRSRAPSSSFRPRFDSPGFPPPAHNVYPPHRQPFLPSQRPYGFMDNPGPQERRPGIRPGAWQVAGPRQGFRPVGYPEQQRVYRVSTIYKKTWLSLLYKYWVYWSALSLKQL